MSMEDNKIDKTIKNLSVVFLFIFLLSTIFIGIVLVGNVLFGVNSTQPPEILLGLLWIFFVIFGIIYITIFAINYPSKPDGIKKRKDRNPIAEKILTITGMMLFWMFLGLSAFIVLMVVWSLVIEFPSMLSMEVIIANLVSVIAIFFIQLIILWWMNHSIKKIKQKKKDAEENRQWQKKQALSKHIPKNVLEAKEYLITRFNKGHYKAKLDKEAFRIELGKLSDEQTFKDYFEAKLDETLIMFDRYAK